MVIKVKSFIVAMVIFAVLTAGGMVFDRCLNETSSQLLEDCERINRDIEGNDFEGAYDKTERLAEYIDGKKPLLSSILDHSSIDEIEQEISELSGYTEKRDGINSTVSVKKLKHSLEHLPENYALKLQNIL